MKFKFKSILVLLVLLIFSITLGSCGEIIETLDDAFSFETSSDSSISDDVVNSDGLATKSKDNTSEQSFENDILNEESSSVAINENGTYTTAKDVALYIHTYSKLPSNFITKNEARNLGWEGGGLEDFAPGKCIGGDRFGNYEGLLPEKNGRFYTECDIDTLGTNSRGAKRIVFSNDGLIYYTEDHYESFELLYGEE